MGTVRRDRPAEQWERNATEDPFWAILTDPRRSDRAWSDADFFATGELEWRLVQAFMKEQGLTPDLSGAFLDFGCGVGRVSRQLGASFAGGLGVDVSKEMVAVARRLNPDVEFVANEAADLGIVADSSVAFVYSHLVLQHMPPGQQAMFIREFLRVMQPGGIAVFQVLVAIEDGRPRWRRMVGRFLGPTKRRLIRALKRTSTPLVQMEMHVIPSRRVERIVESAGGHVIAAPFTNSADPAHNGAVRFFNHDVALRRVSKEPGASPILSRFFIVRRATAQPEDPGSIWQTVG
jgi:SAM-dependent methyltransferase